MKNTINKTTVIIFVLLAVMVIFPAGVFAGGIVEKIEDYFFRQIPASLEITETVTLSDDSIDSALISYSLSAGQTGVKIEVDQFNVDYGVYSTIENAVKVYRKSSDGSKICNASDGIPIAIALNNLFANAQTPSNKTLTEDAADIFINLTDLKVSTGSTTLSTLTDEQTEIIEVEGSSGAFYYREYGVDRAFDVLLLDGEGEYIRFCFMLMTEFFQNEYELYTNHPTVDYEEKAIAFMGKVIGNDFQAHYSELNMLPAASSINWSLFDNDTDAELLSKAETDFIRKLSMHMDITADQLWDEGYPVLDTDILAENLYSNDANIYIKAYLHYCLYKSKPVLSEVFTDVYEKHDISNYDYTNFTPLTSDEGKLFAKFAMRYYSWGVEYTPFAGYNTSVSANSLVDVYSRFSKEPYFQNWLDGGIEGNLSRTNNYITNLATYTSSETIPETPSLSTNEVSELVVLPKNYENGMSISRIDLWSSKNIAWNESGISPKVWAVTEEDGSYSFIEKTKETSSAMNDETLILEEVGTNGDENLRIEKATDTPGASMGFGYQFSDNETSVQALLIVKGYCAVENGEVSDYPTMYENEEYISVLFNEGTEASPVWRKLQPSEYIECVTDNGQNNYTFYPDTNNRKPGYGIWNDYFSNGNSELVYSYLIFDAPVNCSQIAVVDSQNTEINITEMAVFGSDPLQNLNWERTEETNGTLEISWDSTEVSSSPVLTGIEGIMLNGAPGTVYNVGAEASCSIRITTKAVAPVSHILCWKGAGNSLTLNNDLRFSFGNNGVISNDYFVPITNLGEEKTWEAVTAMSIDTP